jgi:hypothetical protein
MRVLTIRPLALGWALSLAGVEEMLFSSGAEAEASARRLAARLSDIGEAVKLIVTLRDGSVAGRFLFPPLGPAIGEELRGVA